MSKRGTVVSNGAMLELWRPPKGAGDPLGCLTTTYTFDPALFDEQCLAMFMEIESEPDREDLAFLLERECKLGSVYAGVIVDYTQAGVEHSLRWDVLPVRIRAGKQHAKLSLLVWSHHIRIVVTSANLTEPGYRTNFEVAATVDLEKEQGDADALAGAISFLRTLLAFVPGVSESLPEALRAERFLDQVERQARGWGDNKRNKSIRQKLVCTSPAAGAGRAARSALEEAIQYCRSRGSSPTQTWIASPFFDLNSGSEIVTASLCKSLARGGRRDACFGVPANRDDGGTGIARLEAPRSLLDTPKRYDCDVTIEILPTSDRDKNLRPWHAKMIAFIAKQGSDNGYTALMTGSSNFTCAGMGIGKNRNIEANLLTIVDNIAFSRDVSQLEAIWPEMTAVDDPESAEWLGARPENEEDEETKTVPLPAGFLSATYKAGENREILIRFDGEHLPAQWSIRSCGQTDMELMISTLWTENGAKSLERIPWTQIQPPTKLLIQWEGKEAFLPLNVEDSSSLPPPTRLENMSADDMLWILAAADPSAAFRTWAKRQQPEDSDDSELDSATPVDLDPLHRYDLNMTFLHRIRRRARVFAQLRGNLQRPVWGATALEWRLRGIIGVEALAKRFVQELEKADGSADEALLTLADFLIVLKEVDYQPQEGSLSKSDFDRIFQPFLQGLALKLSDDVEGMKDRLSVDLMQFWKRVVRQCQE